MANASNVFRVGDYVYVETNPSLPYQIRRIEELTKTSNGQVEAKVQCFFRKRDLSSTLAMQSEKHIVQAEEDAEIEMGDNEVDDISRHQMSHREVFLSRQYENINANTIRGKCLVTLYNETEILSRYLEKEDWFYYFLVYDPQQKTLVADKGEMGIGSAYQANIPKEPSEDDRDLSKLETLVWNPDNRLSEREIDQFLVVARSIGTFARALDCSSSIKQPSLHMSAAAASRDITLFHAMCELHTNRYNVSKAIADLVPAGGPILCRDEMEEWSAGEANLFEEALQKYGKDFSDIQKDFLPWKSLSNIVEYYYMWKTTDRYLQQKRLKAVSKECNLTQIYIPGLGGTTTSLGGKKQTSTIILTPPPGVASSLVGVSCEGCYGCSSQQWYPWSVANSQHRFWLCTLCWIYWKKYGGLKRPDGLAGRGHSSLEPSYTCRICGKVFNRAERLSSHMTTHKAYRCVVSGCGKMFNSKPHLTRHLTAGHGYRPPSPRKLKPRSAFYMKATPLTKVARVLCKEILNVSRQTRAPGRPLNIPEIKTQCLKRVQKPDAQSIIDAKRQMKKRDLEESVERIKKNPPKPAPPKPNKPHDLNIPSNTVTSPPPTSPALSTTSPSRKLLPPVKSCVAIQPSTPKTSNWKYNALPPAKPVVQQQQQQPQQQPASNHLLSRKRSYDSSGVQQNGIDGPAHKRMSATSPLGKKGCECSYCGKILHNQVSLTHHEQTMHSSKEPPKQRSYPAYCDVSPAMGPGSNKIVPYAQHSVTSYNNGQLVVEKSALSSYPASGQPHKPYLLPKPSPMTGAKGGEVANSKAVLKVSRGKTANKSKKEQRGSPQYIRPPEEFVFMSNKKSRKARRCIPADAQKKVARKPWREVKCSSHLRKVIAIEKQPNQSPKESDVEAIVIDDD